MDFTGQALLSDKYSLTMPQLYWRNGQNQRTTFELVVRNLPKNRGYLVVAGLERAVEHILAFRFQASDIEYLATLGMYDQAFLDYLASLRFDGDVLAIPEGTVVGAHTPLLQVTASRIWTTLLEGSLLNIYNYATMTATKTARIVNAAAGRPVIEFGFRRAPGPEAALTAARSAYLAGCQGTSLLLAGKTFGIPTTGTMAHAFVLARGPSGEQLSFEDQLRGYPELGALLVDTYETETGVKRAIRASLATEVPLQLLRLDTLSRAPAEVRQARSLLDQAGMQDCKIMLSDSLDEYSIADLVADKVPIDIFAVGTELVTSGDAPSLPGVYKLVEQDLSGLSRFPSKLCVGKESDPGAHQVFRIGKIDTLALFSESLPGKPLLEPVLRAGSLVNPLPSLASIRTHCQKEQNSLPSSQTGLRDPEIKTVLRTKALLSLREQVREAVINESQALVTS